MNPATAFGTVLVDELCRHGLRDAVIAPGSRSAPLALALAADERVRLHVRHDERSAAFLAVGLARGAGDGRPCLVVTTSGTAAANLHPAVVEAHHAGVPLIVATADRPPELRDTGANQTIDQVWLFGGAVRWFSDVGVPDAGAPAAGYWRSIASRGWAEACGLLGGRPGPVHLNCPLREPLVADDPPPRDLGGRPDGAPWTATWPSQGPGAPPPPPPAAVDAITDVARRWPRGVVVAGDGAGRAPGWITALAEHAGWPLLAEPHSQARRGPNAIRAADLLLRVDGFAGAHRPDGAIVVGKPGLSRALQRWLAPDVPQIVIPGSAGVADPSRTASVILAADPDALGAAVGLHRGAAEASAGSPDALDGPRGRLAAAPLANLGRTDSPWLAAWREADRAASAAVDDVLDGTDAPTEPRLARDLAAALPDGAALAVASSMPIRDLDAVLAPRDDLRLLANRGASGVDGFVSTAVGVALRHGGPTAALAGDLSLLHDQNGLLIPPGDSRPDLVFVVANNDGGGIFSLLPHAAQPAHFERVFGTPHGLDLARLAALYRIGFRRLEQAGDLAGLLRDAWAAGGLQLIEARTDRSANAALHRRLQDAVARAVSPPGPTASRGV